jgi:hypothetical protein
MGYATALRAVAYQAVIASADSVGPERSASGSGTTGDPSAAFLGRAASRVVQAWGHRSWGLP